MPRRKDKWERAQSKWDASTKAERKNWLRRAGVPFMGCANYRFSQLGIYYAQKLLKS